MSIHKDHRQRVKNRFTKEGLENFDDLHILEMMLFYCVPRRDTNELAHNLLSRFGSLPNVMDATKDQLLKVEGIGEGIAVFIRFLSELERTCKDRRNQDVQVINSYMDIKRCMQSKLEGRRNEYVYMLCMDSKRKILCIEKIAEGSVNTANVPMRRIVEVALGVNAVSVVLAHNHPGGVAVPSPGDIKTTEFVAEALKMVDVELADHVIVADEDFVSMHQSGVYNPDAVK